MLRLLLQTLSLLFISDKKNEPVRLAKNEKQKFTIPLNLTLAIIAVLITLFFIMLLLLALNGVSMTESGQVYNMEV